MLLLILPLDPGRLLFIFAGILGSVVFQSHPLLSIRLLLNTLPLDIDFPVFLGTLLRTLEIKIEYQGFLDANINVHVLLARQPIIVFLLED